MDVGTWLRGLGLDQYDDLFREQAIEADILTELTDQHLSELGIPLGHRLRLLRAIRELASEPAAASEPIAPDAPERRQLTVMFCDLVGSTELTARLDPEDMADLIRAFQGAVATAVARFEGHIAKWMGDAAMVYFGYPRAHEDDASRAVRAGLALIEAVARLRQEHGAALEVRIGIATGLVVVGELIGEGEARLRGLVGDTPHLAMRLQSIAEPDTIVVGEATRRLLGEAFELKPLGAKTFRGFAAAIPTWLIAAARDNVSRFEASHSELTPFVGREEEISLLLGCWRRAAEGEGQVAMLSGEAGIGKSRIVAALRERLGTEHHVQLRYQCSPHHVNDAFHPVIGQLWHVAGLVSGEPVDTRLAKLEKMVKSVGLDPADIVPFYAVLLAIPTGSRYPPLELAPAEMKERTITALIAPVLALARQTPILMMLEDTHWIDPTSLDLTHRVVEMVRHLPILLVMTFRPEFVPRWLGRDHVTALSLNRLGRDQALTMIDGVVDGKSLPAEVLDQILAKTDGVPLFIEELTKSVLESEFLHEDEDSYVLTSALTPLAIPSTLHDSLTARLDRLSPIKETAQIGAAIGREFPHALLEAISPIKGAALNDVLRQLMEAELIYRRGIPPNASYVFKHALVQDAAYGSLLRSRRQRIHAQIARALKDHLTEEEYAPATIAHHFTEAGLATDAAPAWLAAAELALSQSAPVEAERHSSAGLSMMSAIPEGRARDALELALLVARANALVPLKSASASETFAAMMDAKRLLDRGIGTDLQRVSVLYGLCAGTTLAARLNDALAFAREIIEVAERLDDPAYRVLGYRQLATIQFYTGQNREALASLQRGYAYRDQQRQRALSYRFGWDQGLAILSFEVLVRLSLGLLDSAARVRDQALTEVSGHGHATTIASTSFCVRTWPQLALRQLAELERGSAELAIFCAEKKVEQIRLLASLHQAYAHAMRVPTAANVNVLREALAALRRSGGNTGNSIILSNLAEAELAAGDVEGAEATLKDGFAFVEQSGERYWLADLNRLAGQVALRQREPDRERAEACFRRAIEVARSQEARLLELRAAIDLGRLWQGARRDDEVRALIAPILGQIEGGATAPDVHNARALLSELA